MLIHGSLKEVGPSRVVVLGASGFIGSRLVQLLNRNRTSCLPIGSRDVDLTKSDATKKLRSFFAPGDSIVMLSALTPEKGRDSRTFLKNVAMSECLCNALSGASLNHMVYVSSDSVYDWRSREISEHSCCETNDLYALSHIVREKLLADACVRAHLDLAIVRPTAVYGIGDSHGSYGPNRFLRSSVTEGKIALFGQGEEERDHIFVDDLCRLILLCLAHRSSGILNAVTGTALSFAEIAREIAELVGRDLMIETLPRQMPIRHRRFDAAALKAAFPNFETTRFRDGIQTVLEATADMLRPERDQRGMSVRDNE